MTFRDSAKDPVTGIVNSSTEYWFFQSASSTGSSTLVYNDLTVPASPNYPVYPAAGIRYMMNLPGTPYYNGAVAGTNPWYVVNVTQDTTLVRVAYDATLTANTYKIFPNTQQRVSAMEIHVGVGSGAVSDVISYSGYFENCVISSTNMNSIVANSLSSSHVLTHAIDSTDGLIVFNSTAKVGFGGEASPDCDPGGITLNNGASDGFLLTAKNSDINHGGLASLEIDTFLALSKWSNASGGARFTAVGSDKYAFSILADCATGSTSGGIIQFIGKTSGAAMNSSHILFEVVNNVSLGVSVYGDGRLDASPGGVRTKRVESANALGLANLNAAFGNSTNLGHGFQGIYQVTSSNTYSVWVVGANSTAWGYEQLDVIST